MKLILNFLKKYANHNNDYPLSPDRIEIKEEMLPLCQILIADFHNIYIGNVQKLEPNLSDKEKFVVHYENLAQNLTQKEE